ncbi:peptide ABC transporter ATP-binding protein [Oceanobacillus oncorhynchi subsp. incaldanensis]|uniref:Putative hemin import ATP-binding protein HrtA n=2 Tax=Oceanobacillus TaxID=182709 RepID=A0A0A1M5N0_9BACI|nr:ABC transporter ATP-binding protein [Oceanobacillus oncorhynchi]MDM8098974.1 ABC transporter ATP-binding protein [Oceanobacillus oncorhynchi]GIO20702.1 peptide ABC transporter ATP-binding protein [Oceanobacillus oncorhynchi subsp. incaldanensis]CEI80610.1 Putative hemin import ATP-binding protein HrtA [Oceanobacillus oncorhynchi]
MAILELKKVQKTFGSGRTKVEAMKETNFEAQQGELVAVIGPSGSGKSTFLSIAGGLQTPTAGEVRMNGTALTDLKEKKRAALRLKEVGFVLQASNLVPYLNVGQQMQLLDKVKKGNMSKAESEALYQSLGIDHLLCSFPKDLSGGERQRVAIAKALYTNPSLILADEPTASLDSDRAFEVMRMLKEITEEKQTATIVVTHDTRLIEDCDKVYQMTDGNMELQEKERYTV